MHSLIGHELSRARERRLAVREAKQRRRETVDLRCPDRARSVATDLRRLGAEHPARHRDRIAADVHQRAAAVLGAASNVVRVAAKVAEVAADETQLADTRRTRDESSTCEPLRVPAHHERLGDLHAGSIACGEQLPRLVGGQRDRLLAEHVLARVGGANGPGHVQVIRQRIVDRVDLGIGDQLVVRAVRARNAERRRGRARLARRSRDAMATTRECGGRLHRRNHLGQRDVRRAENAPANWLAHAWDLHCRHR